LDEEDESFLVVSMCMEFAVGLACCATLEKKKEDESEARVCILDYYDSSSVSLISPGEGGNLADPDGSR
jgi:hypothetical protein